MINTFLMALVSPFLEKNPQKVLAARVPVVFSITRIVIGAFALALFRQMWVAGIAGWPEATLCIALVFANHIASALEKLPAREVVEFGKAIIGRFGEGDVGQGGDLWKDNETGDSHPIRDYRA